MDKDISATVALSDSNDQASVQLIETEVQHELPEGQVFSKNVGEQIQTCS